MKRIVVNGGKMLKGEITVSGSKNAALPIVFACILTNGVSRIENLPDIGDVRVALSLLASLGAKVDRCDNVTTIDTTNLCYVDPDPALALKIRASTYLLGACLPRFGRCPIPAFGGCNFSPRPIDMHLDACLALGARVEKDFVFCNKLCGNEIYFKQPSVGATVNAILLSATAQGYTEIHGCAIEPHIDSLICFLNSCGAEINRLGRVIHVKGKILHGGRASVIGDMIEAGSYLALSLMCEGRIVVKNSPIKDMVAFFDMLDSLGASVTLDGEAIYTDVCNGRATSVTTSPYPGFPTDLQPLVAPLMAKFEGGEITDTVWPDRFGYLSALSPFGIRSVAQGNKAKIYHSDIHNGNTIAPDLRGGMACIITALSTKGESNIGSLDTILRGYENLESKLLSLGAQIKIINT